MINEIINSKNNFINIKGVPGGGKTSLAVSISKSMPDKKLCYLSFGKENAKKTKQRLPSNVDCMSMHSFSFNQLGLNKNRISPNLNMSSLNASLRRIALDPREAKILEAIFIILSDFCFNRLTMKSMANKITSMRQLPNMNREEQNYAYYCFKTYWEALWEHNSVLPVTHDMYLKHYALEPSILDYDLIFVDEKQDLNEAMYYMIEKISAYNPRTKIINLGDPCQQIFGFRGNSERFLGEKFDFEITQTRRFGKDICNLTEKLMIDQSIDYFTRIEPAQLNTELSETPSPKHIAIDVISGRRPTLISRNNITLWYMLKYFAKNNIKCSILGGINQHELVMLKMLHRAYVDPKFQSKKLAGNSYKGFKRIANLNHDQSMILSIKFVENLEADFDFGIIQKCVSQQGSAQVQLTTVHQAKGLEFKDLIMLNDFSSPYTPQGDIRKHEKEETHLLYTCFTRAKFRLSLPSEWLAYATTFN